MPGSCQFNEKWLEVKQYKKWLRKHATDNRQVFCSLCKKSISLSAMGEGALQWTLAMMKNYRRLGSDSQSELIKKQFNHFCDSVIAEDNSAFKDFDPTQDRVDELLHQHLNNKKQYIELWDFMKQLLLISHGQATVERGFSIKVKNIL